MYFALYIILAISFNQRQTSIGSLAFLINLFHPINLELVRYNWKLVLIKVQMT